MSSEAPRRGGGGGGLSGICLVLIPFNSQMQY